MGNRQKWFWKLITIAVLGIGYLVTRLTGLDMGFSELLGWVILCIIMVFVIKAMLFHKYILQPILAARKTGAEVESQILDKMESGNDREE